VGPGPESHPCVHACGSGGVLAENSDRESQFKETMNQVKRYGRSRKRVGTVCLAGCNIHCFDDEKDCGDP
jgi:hypothetical protein